MLFIFERSFRAVRIQPPDHDTDCARAGFQEARRTHCGASGAECAHNERETRGSQGRMRRGWAGRAAQARWPGRSCKNKGLLFATKLKTACIRQHPETEPGAVRQKG